MQSDNETLIGAQPRLGRVKTKAQLPKDVEEGTLCFVEELGEALQYLDGEWSPAKSKGVPEKGESESG